MQFHWNKDSFGVLFVAQSDVDKTNQSYYGETKLNYLTIDGSHEGLVTLSKFGLYMLSLYVFFLVLYGSGITITSGEHGWFSLELVRKMKNEK